MVLTGVTEFKAAELKKLVNGSRLIPGHFVWCEVRDSGCGMDTEVADRIFDPYFTTKFAGRGLGMSAALGIIKGHDGGFMMETGPASGSSISFLLPVHQTAVTVPARGRTRAVLRTRNGLSLTCMPQPASSLINVSFSPRSRFSMASSGDTGRPFLRGRSSIRRDTRWRYGERSARGHFTIMESHRISTQEQFAPENIPKSDRHKLSLPHPLRSLSPRTRDPSHSRERALPLLDLRPAPRTRSPAGAASRASPVHLPRLQQS